MKGYSHTLLQPLTAVLLPLGMLFDKQYVVLLIVVRDLRSE